MVEDFANNLVPMPQHSCKEVRCRFSHKMPHCHDGTQKKCRVQASHGSFCRHTVFRVSIHANKIRFLLAHFHRACNYRADSDEFQEGVMK